jgi:hypothetical protein
VFYSGSFEGEWRSYGHYQHLKNGTTVWKSYGDISPVFRFAKEKDEITGATNLSAMEDSSIFDVSKTYDNQAKGTTTYEMNMRLSTGRYTETWTPSDGNVMESVGNCYKAKGFVPRVAPGKKAK